MPATINVAHEVSHTEKTPEAVGEDKEVVKLTDNHSKSAEKSVGLQRFTNSCDHTSSSSVDQFFSLVDLTC